jgi:Sec-independent protein translocase protein TatA
MLGIAESTAMFAEIGWPEIVAVLGVVLVLALARRWPNFRDGLSSGLREFRKASRAVEEETFEAGRSAGGIYGKPAAEALTPDNQTAEIYEPAAFQEKHAGRKLQKLWKRLWRVFQRLMPL